MLVLKVMQPLFCGCFNKPKGHGRSPQDGNPQLVKEFPPFIWNQMLLYHILKIPSLDPISSQ
jgi:hypothetical protein